MWKNHAISKRSSSSFCQGPNLNPWATSFVHTFSYIFFSLWWFFYSFFQFKRWTLCTEFMQKKCRPLCSFKTIRPSFVDWNTILQCHQNVHAYSPDYMIFFTTKKVLKWSVFGLLQRRNTGWMWKDQLNLYGRVFAGQAVQ